MRSRVAWQMRSIPPGEGLLGVRTWHDTDGPDEPERVGLGDSRRWACADCLLPTRRRTTERRESEQALLPDTNTNDAMLCHQLEMRILLRTESG